MELETKRRRINATSASKLLTGGFKPSSWSTSAGSSTLDVLNCKENELVSTENELVYDITIAGLKKKSAKKKNIGKKADVEVHRVSVAEPTSEKKQLNWNVVIPTENLDIKGLMLQKVILVCLLDDFSEKKVTKALGYLLAVTTLDKIGEGKVREHSGDVLFPLSFTCLSFKVFRGTTNGFPSNSTFTRLLFYADQTHIKPLIPKQIITYATPEQAFLTYIGSPVTVSPVSVLYISMSKSTLAEVTDNHALFFLSIREVTKYVSLHAELESYMEEMSTGPRAPQQQQTQAISPFTNSGMSCLQNYYISQEGGYGVKNNEHLNRDSFDSSMDVDHDSSTH
ncbi:DNA-directed RNA polymerase V subunit 7-like protein [Tanacetum coccineum]